jgi:hypothetical protein
LFAKNPILFLCKSLVQEGGHYNRSHRPEDSLRD